ncbi:hypothetical protein [Fusobacterium sp.]|uniref:hypothetical protein n=1 Tax=Fusobacterium sp. TaxID=68766 RepID=UPI00261FB66A|nr:hypothetical protein [Fusobacterium sp.]
MNKKDFKDYNTEVMLQILKNANVSLLEAESVKDEEKIKFIKEEIIPKYEKLYLALRELDIRDKSDEEIKTFRETVDKIASTNNLTEEYIKKCIAIREELKGKSGAEVTKRMFEYTLKNFKKKKGILLEKMNVLLKEEAQLEADLKECIQYDAEMEISGKIVDVREKKRDLKEIIDANEKEIEKITNDINSKWKYEIYGTISRDELKKTVEGE